MTLLPHVCRQYYIIKSEVNVRRDKFRECYLSLTLSQCGFNHN